METDIFTDRQKLIFYQVQILDKKEQDLKKTTIRTCMSKVEAQLLAFEKLDLGDKVAIIKKTKYITEEEAEILKKSNIYKITDGFNRCPICHMKADWGLLSKPKKEVIKIKEAKKIKTISLLKQLINDIDKNIFQEK